MATLSPFCIPYFFRVLARRQVRSRSSLRHRNNIVMRQHSPFFAGEQKKDELGPSEASRSPCGPCRLSSIGHASFCILKKGDLGCGESQNASAIGERRKGGWRDTLAAEGRASESHRGCPELPVSGVGRADSNPAALLLLPQVSVRFSHP